MYKKIVIFPMLFIAALNSMDTDKQKYINSLKKPYIDTYFNIDQTTEKSLLAHAPAPLKEWFAAIKENQNTEPVLLYGAHGVGKTLTSQVLVKDAHCSLCYVKSPQEMRGYGFFKKDYLDMTDENTCVIVDNIYQLQEQDMGNLDTLVDTCNKKKNLHLLAIAYKAQKNLPSFLYKKFKVLKFPIPTPQSRLQMFKSPQKNVSFAPDVDKILREDQRCAHYTPQQIKLLRDAAIENFRQERIHETSDSVTLSRHDVDCALSGLELEKKSMQVTFDENE